MLDDLAGPRRVGRGIAMLGTILTATGAVVAVISGPLWLAAVLIVGTCCGIAGVAAGKRR